MITLIYFLLVVSVSATQECSFGEISADTAQFKINLYHQYIHGRHFDVEQRVCDLALNVTQDLISTFSRDLDALLTITSQIFKLFISLVKDRGGRGCVKELKESFQTISKKESKVFKSCMTLPFHKQVELKKEVVSFHNEYQNAFMRILARLDQCQSQFPNAADKDKLNGCVKSNHERYFKKVANIGQDHFNDSCMKVFVESIANCQAKSLDKVKSKTSRLLKLLTNCAQLFNADIDPKLKASAMSAEKQIVLVPSIEAQIKEAQSTYGNIKTDDALEKFIDFMVKAYTTVLEDHPNGYYDKQFKKAMDSYLKAVDRSLRDNKHPQDTTCGRTALQRLNEIVKRASKEYDNCYSQRSRDTSILINDIANSHTFLTSKVDEVGDIAILNCLKDGYIFQTNTIMTCFDTKLRHFTTFDLPKHLKFAETMVKILHEEVPYYGNSTKLLPCADKVLQETKLKADNELFTYQRCMYKSTGTDYSVMELQRAIASGVPFISHYLNSIRIFNASSKTYDEM
ncbi:uncharacterized protein LOC124353590 [Homalodisca vitripennis]|uniref:uncharacterized protein LOC124353590 n=1 Tax=Homalodisca vitripennis TaxID=197043 RepID=UPI001EEC755A|nr:uncharacterized protein LOC124353590 [Homalodisca vitripennis]